MTPPTGRGPSDIRPLQRIRGEKLVVQMPGQHFTTGPPGEPLAPELPDHPIKLPQPAKVRCAPVVLVVAPQHRVESRPLLHDRHGPLSVTPCRNPFQGPTPP